MSGVSLRAAAGLGRTGRRRPHQRGFLDVWRQAGKFEGRSAVSTWLLAITRFKARSVLRRRKNVELDDEAAKPENSVRTRTFYARKKLAELLKASGAERGWP